MQLRILHPEVAGRDCEDCCRFFYNEKTGKREVDRHGQPKPRFTGALPPCRAKPDGCKKGTPENQLSLNDRNAQAYSHYLECKAVGQFPDDPIVRRNAGVIRETEDTLDRWQRERTQMLLEAALTLR